jgi:hypothetical protein
VADSVTFVLPDGAWREVAIDPADPTDSRTFAAAGRGPGEEVMVAIDAMGRLVGVRTRRVSAGGGRIEHSLIFTEFEVAMPP